MAFHNTNLKEAPSGDEKFMGNSQRRPTRLHLPHAPGVASASADEYGKLPGRDERPVEAWQEIGYLGRRRRCEILVSRLAVGEGDRVEDVTLLDLGEVSAKCSLGTLYGESAAWSADLADKLPHLGEVPLAARRCY